MSVLVRTRLTEVSLSGDNAKRLLNYLRRYLKVNEFNAEEEKSVNIRETEFWKGTGSGELLLGYRLKLGLTQKQLAERCGIIQTVISDYEHGKRKITPKALLKLAEGLGIATDRLKAK